MLRLNPRFAVWALPCCVAAITAALTLAGCGPEGAATARAATGKPVILVATTGFVADLAKGVGGGDVEVRNLLGPGVDPHLYKPTAADVRAIREADLVLHTGLKLEEGLHRALESRRAAGGAVVAVTSDLPKDRLRYPEEFDGHPDPHVWMDVALWSECLDTVRREMAGALPEQSDAFAANAAGYQQDLLALDGYVRDAVATIPERQRVLVTAHDAFGYFSRAYDIPVRSVQGVTTESEAGVADINALAGFLAENKVPTVFIETSVSEKAVRAVVEGANRRGGNVTVSETALFSDALGEPGSGGETYVDAIVHNTHAIVGGLGGMLPDGGFVPPSERDAGEGEEPAAVAVAAE